MTGDSWREHRRALLRDDPGAVETAARLLDEMGTEERDDDPAASARPGTSGQRQHHCPTVRGLSDNIELGVVLRDPRLVEPLIDHFHRLLTPENRVMRRV